MREEKEERKKGGKGKREMREEKEGEEEGRKGKRREKGRRKRMWE